MRLKSLTILVVSLQLTLSVTSSSAPAATIAGTKCTKAGAKKVSANITYICSKSGSKLAWKAESRSKAPIAAPVVTPKSTANPSPTATPTPVTTSTSSGSTSPTKAGVVLEKPSGTISIYNEVVNSGANSAARKSLELPAGVTPVVTNNNLKLWIFDPEKTSQALGSPGIFLQKEGGNWNFVGGVLADGIFTTQLSSGTYSMHVVEPNGDQKKYSRGRYTVQVGSDSTLTIQNLLPNSQGFFSVTATVNTRRANELQKFTPTSACQILDQSNSQNMSNAFPRGTGRLTNHGVVRALIIPVAFTDLPGNGSPAEIYKEMARGTADFYYKQSRKTVRFEFSTLKDFIQLGVPVGKFNLGTYNGGDAGALFSAGIKAVDENVNFSDFDVVYVMPPSTIAMNQIAYGPAFPNNVDSNSFLSNEGAILNGTIGGADAWQNIEGAQWKWMAHETGHLYGLFDWYTLDGSNPYGPWDLMSLNWSTEAIEFNAWNRYIQDWLDDSQIQCQSKSDLSSAKEFTIEAIATDSNQPKAVMVKISDTKILVLEVRATAGLDRLSDQQSGVLVYTVDSRIESIKGMSKVYTTPGSSSDLRDAPLQTGEEITVEGINIKVTSFSSITAKVTLSS